MDKAILRTASLDLLFSDYIKAYSVFNNIENLLPAKDKKKFIELKNKYKIAVKNIDKKKAKQILKGASYFLRDISYDQIEKKAQIRLDVSQKELQNELKPFGQYANRHLWARDVIRQAFQKLFGRLPTQSEEQMAQSVALLESSYGRGWKGEGKNSNNWGAIQCCKPKNGKCPANTFMYTDTSPKPDGTSVKYSICFKKYPTPVDGAVDLLKEIFQSKYKNRGEKTQVAAQVGSIPLFSSSMYDSSYYQGFGKDREERIRNHIKAMERYAKIISKATQADLAISGNKDIIPTEDEINQYVATRKTQPMPQPTQQHIPNQELEAEYRSLMTQLFAGNNEDHIVKKAILKEKLPVSRHLITLDDAPFEYRVRLANILTTAFRNYFDAETSIHSDGKHRVELEVDILGTEEPSAKALKALAGAVGDVFKNVIKNSINSNIIINKSSSLPLLDPAVSEKCFRKYALKTW